MIGEADLGITVIDIFNTFKIGQSASSPDFDYSRNSMSDTRAIMFTFVYAFKSSYKEEMIEKKLLLNIGDELFINAGKQIVYNMIDYNRLLIGPAVRFKKNWLVSLIYNYQFGQENKPALYKQSDIIWMTATHTIQSRYVK